MTWKTGQPFITRQSEIELDDVPGGQYQNAMYLSLGSGLVVDKIIICRDKSEES